MHTKAFVVDGRRLFVGSYNLDPRSTWLNCEQGVLVDNAALAHQLEQLFDRQTEVSARGECAPKQGSCSGPTTQLYSDPHASWSRRFQAWLARFLRMDAQL